jgi:hypothetical protein
MFAAATVAVLLPWATYVQLNGGLVGYFVSAINFSRREAQTSSLRTWPVFDAAFAGPSNAEAWLYYLFLALPVAGLALAWRRRLSGREGWRGECAAVSALSVLAVAVNFGFLRDPLNARLADAVVTPALLLAWLAGAAISPSASAFAVRTASRAVAVVLFAITIAAAWQVGHGSESVRRAQLMDASFRAPAAYLRSVWRSINRQDLDPVMFPSRVSGELMPFFAYLQRCSDPSDRLLVTGQNADVFVIGGRGFAGGHVAFLEGYYSSTTEQLLTLERLRRESVPFIVLALDSYDEFRHDFSLLDAHITGVYRPMADVAVPETNGLRILVDRRRAVRRVDADTGWPCFR